MGWAEPAGQFFKVWHLLAADPGATLTPDVSKLKCI
jgi:hypothetical protein